MKLSTGQVIKKYREQNNISQKELAEYVGVTEAAISRYESDINIPRKPRAIKISEKLNIPIEKIILGEIIELEQSVRNISYPSLFKQEDAALAHMFLVDNRINAMGGVNTDALTDEEAVTYANIIQKNKQDAEERSKTEIQLAMFQKFRDEKNK